GEVFEAEIVNRRSDGELIHVDQTIAPVETEDGEIDGFVAVNSDISDVKRRQDQLEAERDRARNLRQRLSVLNRIMRHDLRSSVNIIKGNANLASTGREDGPLQNIVDQAEEVLEIAENARLIEETLSNSDDAKTAQDINATLRTAIAKLRREHPTASIDSTLTEDRWVRAHERLGDALDQLLRNAVEHNDAEHPVVEVRATCRGSDVVEIGIADNGPGIPDGEIEPLGAEIEHGLRHTSGLGLWIAHWIVTRSGGEIGFEDAEPRGTVVTITLPLAEDPPQDR
ncbi:MAG: ATP-binding protein, partial [Halanaeroarchaeum sp.]